MCFKIKRSFLLLSLLTRRSVYILIALQVLVTKNSDIKILNYYNSFIFFYILQAKNKKTNVVISISLIKILFNNINNSILYISTVHNLGIKNTQKSTNQNALPIFVIFFLRMTFKKVIITFYLYSLQHIF